MKNLNKYISTHVCQREYSLSEDEVKCITDKEFYDKTIRNAYDCESLSLIIKNFAFCDKSFSYMIAEVVVRGINEFEFDANEAFYYILESFLEIDDDLLSNFYTDCRIDWVIGVPLLVSQKKSEVYQFGSGILNAIDEEVYSYPSTVYFDQNEMKNSLLGLILSQKKRWDHSCLYSIKNLLKICIKNTKIYEYLFKIPAPTYQFFHFIH